jgi:hypothetical protein
VELDDLRQAMDRLDKRLEGQAAVGAINFRRETRDRLRGSLRPLARGQTWLIVLGVLTAFAGVAVWHSARHAMGGLFACGVIIHVYGVLMIGVGALTKALIGRIDWTGPVLGIQKRLAQLRKARIIAAMILGMPWCFLWVPAIIVAFRLLTGIDIFVFGPATWLWQIGGGVALMTAALLFYRWAKATGRTAITRAIDGTFTGEHLKRAQAELDEIARFDRD